MELLLKNVSLPKEGTLDLHICPNGKVYYRHDGFPIPSLKIKAIELPAHGRLIDADKMELDFRASVANLIEKYPDLKNIFSEYERLVIGILNKTPTVVEASK